MPRRREQPNQCVHWGTINNTNLSPSLSFTPLLPCLLAHTSHSTCWLYRAMMALRGLCSNKWWYCLFCLNELYKVAEEQTLFNANCSSNFSNWTVLLSGINLHSHPSGKVSELGLWAILWGFRIIHITGEKVGPNPLIWVEWQPLIWPGGRQTQTEASLLSVGDLRGIKQRVIKS